MATGIRARLTAVRGRSFGLTLGAAFLALAALLAWRSHAVGALIGATAGVVLALAGLAIPTRLGPVERAWMAMAHAVSKVTTPIVMAAMYFVVVTPVALVRRAFGGNPLEHQPAAGSFWKARPEGARRTRDLRRQF